MKAAVCREFGQPLSVEELTLDDPGPQEVSVKVAATAICHSDLHVIEGAWGGRGGIPPFVAGHESAGVITRIGDQVRRLRPGDRVLVSLLRSCGTCFHCHSGAPFVCSGEFELDKASRMRDASGKAVNMGLWTAAFAEEAVVHASQVALIPADLGMDRASLLACGVITGVGAVLNTADVRAGQSVAVIGTGGVGLNSVQGAALAAADPIIGVDVMPEKRAAATRFGATHTIDPTQGDPEVQVMDLTQGVGVDYVFLTVGSAAAVESSWKMVSRLGALVIVGIPDMHTPLPVPIGQFVGGQRRVLGSRMGSTRLQIDIPRLIALYRQGRLKLDELISGRYPLARINDAIADTLRGSSLRNVIEF